MWWAFPFHESPYSLLSCPGSQARPNPAVHRGAGFSLFPVTLIVEQLVDVPTSGFKTEPTLEQISDTPVPQVVEGTCRGLHSFSQDGVQHRFSELIFEALAMSLAEEIKEVPNIYLHERGIIKVPASRNRS